MEAYLKHQDPMGLVGGEHLKYNSKYNILTSLCNTPCNRRVPITDYTILVGLYK